MVNLCRPVCYLLLGSILLFGFSRCATIPPEAPELSKELGKRITAIERSHMNLLYKYFDQKRAVVDDFIEREWVPLFAQNFFSKPVIENAWNEIVASDDKAERLKFIVKVGPKLQEEINRKRQELIKPLDALEREIERKLRENYNQARSINNSLTSFLTSAAKVAENRQRYLDMLGMTDERIGALINETDDAVSHLLGLAQDAEQKQQMAEEYLKKVNEIKDKVWSK